MLTLEEIPIEKLSLPKTLIRILHRNGIETFGHLQMVMQNGNLGDLRFVGVKRMKEISDLISEVISQSNKFTGRMVQSVADQESNLLKDKTLSQQVENPQADPANDIEIENIGLPRRIINSLRKCRIRTVGDLLNADEGYLLQIYQIGPKSISELQETLKKVLSSPATYIETKTAEQEKLMTWAELAEPYLTSEKDTRIYTLICRFGLKRKTLEKTSEELGVTRERVRQLQEVVARRFTRYTNARPLSSSRVLEKAIEILATKQEEMSLNLFRAALIKENILGDFSKPIRSNLSETLDPFEVLICWLDILGDERFTQFPEKYPIQIEDLRKARSISIKNQKILQDLPHKRIRTLLRKVAFTGGINLKDAMKILSAPEDVTLVELQNLKLRKIRDNWYSIKSFKGSRNRFPLILAGNKMLSAFQEIEFSDFYDGLRRHASRFFDSIAPQDVVLHYIQTTGFEVKNSTVMSNPNVENVISNTEACFIAAVKANGNVANFIEIAEEFHQKGFSIPAVSVVLARSPLVEKIDVGLYKIRGCDLLWMDIENAKKRQKSYSKDAQVSYGLDGTIRYKVTLNSWAIYTGVVSTNLIKDLAGKWKVINNAGKQVTVNMDELFIWGIGNILKEIRANVGDRIELSFNTWNRTLSAQKVEHGAT